MTRRSEHSGRESILVTVGVTVGGTLSVDTQRSLNSIGLSSSVDTHPPSFVGRGRRGETEEGKVYPGPG